MPRINRVRVLITLVQLGEMSGLFAKFKKKNRSDLPVEEPAVEFKPPAPPDEGVSPSPPPPPPPPPPSSLPSPGPAIQNNSNSIFSGLHLSSKVSHNQVPDYLESDRQG